MMQPPIDRVVKTGYHDYMARQHKDSAFRMIFADNKKAILALHNAIHKTAYILENTELLINTLDESLWTFKKNDLSYILNGQLVVIIEHVRHEVIYLTEQDMKYIHRSTPSTWGNATCRCVPGNGQVLSGGQSGKRIPLNPVTRA